MIRNAARWAECHLDFLRENQALGTIVPLSAYALFASATPRRNSTPLNDGVKSDHADRADARLMG